MKNALSLKINKMRFGVIIKTMSSQPDHLTAFSQFMHEVNSGTEYNASDFGNQFKYENLKNLLGMLALLNKHRVNLENSLKIVFFEGFEDTNLPDKATLEDQFNQNEVGIKYFNKLAYETFVNSCKTELVDSLVVRYRNRATDRLSN